MSRNSGPISKSISGQISIVAATITATTFFLFFAFVVNTGMLVHAKINLQNAADVAAYAGAATQARQLDTIGALNYELMRQYKRFVFRYYVVGNLNRPYSAPDSIIGNTLQFGAKRTTTNRYQNMVAPSVCLIFKADDNYCQIFDLKPVTTRTRPGFTDAISIALGQVLDKLEEIRERNCSGLSMANLLALTLWLYNTEPDGSGNLINTVYTDPQTQLALQTLPNITKGLGIIPRNNITYQRINTLAGTDFLNQPAKSDVTANVVRALESDRHPMKHERTALAYKSAQRTLGESIFGGDNFTLDEILPTRPFELKPVEATFTAYATWVGKVGGPNSACEQQLYPINVPRLPIAVYMNSAPIFYGVKLRATPQLLFNPFNYKLEAFAAAKPFGSSLGPKNLQAQAECYQKRVRLDPSVNLVGGIFGRTSDNVPDICLYDPGDPRGPPWGLSNKNLFLPLKNYIFSGGPADQIGKRLIEAEAIASLPNEAEWGRFIIPNDYSSPGTERFKEHFQDGVYSVYAPISTGVGDGRTEIENVIATIPRTAEFDKVRAKLIRDLGTYFSKLRNNQGELGEGVQVAKLMNPEHDVLKNSVKNKAPEGFPKITESALRPWFSGVGLAPNRDSTGRTGYSVKLVPFRSLQNLPAGEFSFSLLDH